jgi:hypothetical protein
MRQALAAASVLVMACAAGAQAAADETYAGTVAIAQAQGAPASVPVTVTLRQYTSDERTNQLAQILHDRGNAAAVAALAKEDLGQIRLGDTTTFRVTVARQEPTERGQILRLVSDRPMYTGAKPPGPAPSADVVGYLELTLTKAGTGEGRLMPAVTAKFDDDGFVAPENSDGPTWPVSGVKRTP